MPTAFSCFSSPPPCRGQLPVGGCLAIFVLLIKNSATQYCIRASVTFFVCLRLLSWAQLLFGNSKDISQILLRTSYPSPQFCCQPCLSHWLSWEVRKKNQLPGLPPRAVVPNRREGNLFPISFWWCWHKSHWPGLRWVPTYLGPVASHIFLSVQPEVHFPDGKDRASEAASLGKLQGGWCWRLKLSAFSTTSNASLDTKAVGSRGVQRQADVDWRLVGVSASFWKF